MSKGLHKATSPIKQKTRLDLNSSPNASGSIDKKYIITTKTGKSSTDSNVYITIYGTKCDTEKIYLKNSSKIGVQTRIFDKFKADEFTIYSKDVGKILKIKIGREGEEEWDLEYVKIFVGDQKYEFKPKRQFDSETKFIELYDEFDLQNGRVKEAAGADSPNKERVEYHIRVKFGHESGVESSGNLAVTLFNHKRESSGRIELSKSKRVNVESDLHARDNEAHYIIEEKNLYNLDRIILSYGSMNRWYLDSVSIHFDGYKYKFGAGFWLENKDDGGSVTLRVVAQSKGRIKKLESRPKSLEKYTLLELKRLKTALERESSKIRFPKRREHEPFVFNDLCPYYDVKDVEKLVHLPQNEIPIGYLNRATAIGIVDPPIAHVMENTMSKLDRKSRKEGARERGLNLHHNLTNKLASTRGNKIEYEGNTLTPRFPIITMKKPKSMTGPFYVDQVREIREQLHKNFGDGSETRKAEDKSRTVNDFYRMKLDQFHPVSKRHMLQVYRAYLENTLGSKQALHELLKNDQQFQEIASTLAELRKPKTAPLLN